MRFENCADGELFVSGFYRVHPFVGPFHRVLEIECIPGNGRKSTTDTEQKFSIGLMRRIPNNHSTEVSDLHAQDFWIHQAQDKELIAAEAAGQLRIGER